MSTRKNISSHFFSQCVVSILVLSVISVAQIAQFVERLRFVPKVVGSSLTGTRKSLDIGISEMLSCVA